MMTTTPKKNQPLLLRTLSILTSINLMEILKEEDKLTPRGAMEMKIVIDLGKRSQRRK